MHARREVAAWISLLPAALNVAYAAMGGISSDPALRWLQALVTVAGAALVWRAARHGPWRIAWLGLAFIMVPAAVSWPEIGVSPGGLLALLLILATALAVTVASVPRPRPPHLSPG